MPTTSWTFSGDLTFPNRDTWLPILDTGEHVVINSVQASSLTVTDVTGGEVDYGIYAVDYSTGSDGSSVCIDFNAFGGPVTWPFSGSPCTAINGATRVRVYVYARGRISYPHVLHVEASGTYTNTPLPATYCAYGTELKPGVSTNMILTAAFITEVLDATELSWLSVLFDALVGLQISPDGICNSLPPPFPASVYQWILADNPFATPLPSISDMLQAFTVLAWNTLCQCVTGSPTPTPPVLPDITPTGGAPTPVSLVCDNADLCTTLQNLQSQLAGIGQQVGLLRSDVTLIQRQSVPFGYLTSTCHTDLTGDGAFAVQGILGLSVSFTGGGSTIGSEPGAPDTLFDVGWVNVGDTRGFRSRERIRTNPWVYFPPLAGEVTTVGYSLNPLVTAVICELVREL